MSPMKLVKNNKKYRCIYYVRESHIGASFISLALFFCKKSEFAHASPPPFSQKGTLDSPVRLQARSRTAHCRYHLFARKVPSAHKYLNCSAFKVFLKGFFN